MEGAWRKFTRTLHTLDQRWVGGKDLPHACVRSRKSLRGSEMSQGCSGRGLGGVWGESGSGLGCFGRLCGGVWDALGGSGRSLGGSGRFWMVQFLTA
jgi:hypothetical protein